MFIPSNSPRISRVVNEPSEIPSVHSLNHKPQLFLPMITLRSTLGCLLLNSWSFITPFSNSLNDTIPSLPFLLSFTSTSEPQKSSTPRRYDCKKNLNISMNLSECFCRLRSLRLPISSLRVSISSCLLLA
jgi:hypothetical protein